MIHIWVLQLSLYLVDSLFGAADVPVEFFALSPPFLQVKFRDTLAGCTHRVTAYLIGGIFYRFLVLNDGLIMDIILGASLYIALL